MWKSLMAAMVVSAPMGSVSGEVEYEIHAGYRSGDCFGTGAGSCRLLELRTYHAAPGKLDALLARFRDHTVALFGKHGMRNVGYWVPVENKDNLLVYLLAYPDRESRDASWKAFLDDPEWKKAAADSEAGGKLVAKVDSVFLEPTDFSEGFWSTDAEPPMTTSTVKVNGKLIEEPAEPAKPQHLFEMRTYTTVKGRLPNLHARFRDHTLALFKKHGMTNLAYFQPTEGQPGADGTLLYFLAHKDMEAATKSWADFRADADWVAAKKASEEKAGGSLTTEGGVVSVFLKPTDFSPVK